MKQILLPARGGSRSLSAGATFSAADCAAATTVAPPRPVITAKVQSVSLKRRRISASSVRSRLGQSHAPLARCPKPAPLLPEGSVSAIWAPRHATGVVLDRDDQDEGRKTG